MIVKVPVGFGVLDQLPELIVILRVEWSLRIKYAQVNDHSNDAQPTPPSLSLSLSLSLFVCV